MNNNLELPKNYVELSKTEMESITSGPAYQSSPTTLYTIIRKSIKPIKNPFYNKSR